MKKPERLRVVAALALGLCVTIAGCSANNAETETSAGDAVARIGDDTITVSELDAYLQKTNPKAYQQLFDARRAALDQMLADRLMAAEAESRGITPAQLEQDLSAGAPAVTEQEVAAFYNQNQARMGGRSLEDMSGQIRNYLANTRTQQARAALINDLRQKSSVAILMEPPRMDVKVAANDPSQGGPEDAPILLVEFSDFQ